MLSAIEFFATGLLLGLAFIIIVFFVTLWRHRRRERRETLAASGLPPGPR